MPYFKATLCAALVFITLSAQTLHAEKKPGPEPLFSELLNNMPFYLEYLTYAPYFYYSLSANERGQLHLLQQYLKDLGHTPAIDFSRLQEEFVLQQSQPERIAKTTNESHSTIDFNLHLLMKKYVLLDIPFAIQLLIHELGRKLDDKEDEGVIDSLATKAAIYFKAYTQEQGKLLVLSLPLKWFPFPFRPTWQRPDFRRRPHTAIFLKQSAADFQSLTEQVFTQLDNAVGYYLPVGLTKQDMYTDAQDFLYGLDRTREGKLTVFVRNQKKLQGTKQIKHSFGFPEEPFTKVITQEQQLLLNFDSGELNVEVIPTGQADLASSVRTSLEQEASGFYRLTLPDFDTSEKLKLRLSTGAGFVLLAREPNETQPTFRFQIPSAGTSEFVEIHSIINEKKQIQFLDKAYWFPVPQAQAETALKAKSLQMQVATEWREVDLERNGLDFHWGLNNFRIQLQNNKKIRQVRFVWGMIRRHYKSSDIKKPQFYQPFGPTVFVVSGKIGTQYAEEKDIYEETFSEGEFTQAEQLLTVQLDMAPKHIITFSFTNVRHVISRFFSLVSNITFNEIRGEDVGYRQLLDILVTDEDLQTTSVLKNFKSQGLQFTTTPSCSDQMAQKYYDQFE